MDRKRPTGLSHRMSRRLRLAWCAAVIMLLPRSGGASPQGEATPEPVRAEARRLAVAGELGWNGLAGVGLNLGVYLTPRVAVEVGGGLGAVGWKAGARTRFSLLRSNLTPFVAAGAMVGSGSMGRTLSLEDDTSPVEFQLGRSLFAQAVVGLAYTAPSGFLVNASVGRAERLHGGRVRVVSGQPTALQEDVFRLLYGSGPVLSVAFGYAFR